MQLDASWWLSHVLSFLIGIATSGVFFVLQAKIDLRSLTEAFHRLREKIELVVSHLSERMELEPYSELIPMEARLASFLREEFAARRGRLHDSGVLDLCDFDAGWRLLFEEVFSGRGGSLRDATLSSHGGTSFQRYDFTSYVGLVWEYVEKIKDRSHDVYFLVVCSEGQGEGQNNERAEKYLRSLLELKYPSCNRIVELFDRWRQGDPGDRPNIHVMITNDAVLRRVMGLAGDLGSVTFDCPFNVYGDLAVSRSIVRGESPGRPVPHLDIRIEPDVVRRFSRLFDLVWKESVGFKDKVLGDLTSEDKRGIGSGNMLHRWSEVQEW